MCSELLSRSSFENESRSSPSSWRYMQSGLLQGTERRKYEQYFVVPNEALMGRPSMCVPSVAAMARMASSACM